MDTFFNTHRFLIENLNHPIHRTLMDQIDWRQRLIGIRGPQGIGKTTFLLQYAKENFELSSRKCLYINMDSFYFQGRGIVDFADEFTSLGGKVLLIDQMYKHNNWCDDLLTCYFRYPSLQILYTTTSVEESGIAYNELQRITHNYDLHGLSFREYVNMKTGSDIKPFELDDLISNREQIIRDILPTVRPWNYFQNYLRHGYYPLFTESRDFTNNLLNTINSMIDVDILFIKQMELKYLSRIKMLLYLIAISGPSSPNVSKLAEDIKTSRATVMNYIKYLEEARFINLLYKEGDSFPKKPALIMAHDTNLMYSIYPQGINLQEAMETFFVNALWDDHTVYLGRKPGFFVVDGKHEICVCNRNRRPKKGSNTLYVKYNMEITQGNEMPLWLFGFTY